MTASASLRHDLFYRLNQTTIMVPPLRLRVDDVEPLAFAIVQRLGQARGRQKTLSTAAVAALREHGWPGNAHELDATLTQAYHAADDIIEPPFVLRDRVPPFIDSATTLIVPLGVPMEEIQRRM